MARVAKRLKVHPIIRSALPARHDVVDVGGLRTATADRMLGEDAGANGLPCRAVSTLGTRGPFVHSAAPAVGVLA
jgi:hypothetical protein